MFPAGAPGMGLLLLRIGVAVMLLFKALPNGELEGSWWIEAGLVTIATALCIGVYTPVACVASFIAQLTCFLSTRGSNAGQFVCLTLITLSAGLLGPGAFSVDALLFGRRLIPPPNAL
jgi:hypothetical protein